MGAGGYLEMNVYKPLMISNITQSITLLSDGCSKRPPIELGFVDEQTFDRVVDPAEIVKPYVAAS